MTYKKSGNKTLYYIDYFDGKIEPGVLRHEGCWKMHLSLQGMDGR